MKWLWTEEWTAANFCRHRICRKRSIARSRRRNGKRQYENYHHKIADIFAAVDALAARSEVDANRIGGVGVCLGSGYILHAATRHKGIRAAGTVVVYYRDVPDMQAADPEGFAAKVDQGIEARKHYERTGEVVTVPAAALTGDAAMTLQSTYASKSDYPSVRVNCTPNYELLAVQRR